MVNAWMQVPGGFDLTDGKVTAVRPLEVFFNPATVPLALHMVVAAYVVTGSLVAATYAFLRLRGKDGLHERRAMALGLLLALPLALPQALVGDLTAKVVAEAQPVKFAAMKGQFRTERRAPLRQGGFPDVAARETKFAIEIPGMLSLMGYGDMDAEVVGLNDFPADELPPIPIVYQAFQVMVGIGTLLIVLSLGVAFFLWRRRRLPEDRRFLWLLVAMGPLSVVAMEAGWVLTEVGRQPWIVQGYMRTEEAVTHASGVGVALVVAVVVYTILTVGAVLVLRALSRIPLPESSS
jgi:cytochrome d ubiquinol oxidase subunit I